MIFFAALLFASLQPAEAPEMEDSTFSERQPVRLAPLPAERALTAFRDVCMANLADPDGFDAAAAAAGLGFAKTPETARTTREWSSVHGQIVLRRDPNPERTARRDRRRGYSGRQRWRERCDYWVAIEERLAPAELVAAIGARLAPDSPPAEGIVGVTWDLGSAEPGTSLRLLYLPSTDDPRIFTLSLQRLVQAPAR